MKVRSRKTKQLLDTAPNEILQIFRDLDFDDIIKFEDPEYYDAGGFKKAYDSLKSAIWKEFLDRYNVKYNDPTNFVYIANLVDYHDYIIPRRPYHVDYPRVAKLYNKFSEMTHCTLGDESRGYPSDAGITSFPTYPKLCSFTARCRTDLWDADERLWIPTSTGSLEYFAYQPNLKVCFITGTRIKEIPYLPELKYGDFSHNNLQGVIKYISSNVRFLGLENNGDITRLKTQDNLEVCYAKGNPDLIEIDKQPNMIVLTTDSDTLKKPQPSLLEFNDAWPTLHESKRSLETIPGTDLPSDVANFIFHRGLVITHDRDPEMFCPRYHNPENDPFKLGRSKAKNGVKVTKRQFNDVMQMDVVYKDIFKTDIERALELELFHAAERLNRENRASENDSESDSDSD